MKSRVRGHRDGGRLFQTSGSQNAKALRPSSVRVHVRRVTAAQVDAERRDRRCGSDVQKATRSATYDGHRCSVQCTGSLLYRIGRGLIVHWVSWASTNLPLSALINMARNCQELRHNGRRMDAVTSMPISVGLIYLGINVVWRFCIT